MGLACHQGGHQLWSNFNFCCILNKQCTLFNFSLLLATFKTLNSCQIYMYCFQGYPFHIVATKNKFEKFSLFFYTSLTLKQNRTEKDASIKRNEQNGEFVQIARTNLTPDSISFQSCFYIKHCQGWQMLLQHFDHISVTLLKSLIKFLCFNANRQPQSKDEGSFQMLAVNLFLNSYITVLECINAFFKVFFTLLFAEQTYCYPQSEHTQPSRCSFSPRHNLKQLEVFLLPQEGMLVHCRVYPPPLCQQYPRLNSQV